MLKKYNIVSYCIYKPFINLDKSLFLKSIKKFFLFKNISHKVLFKKFYKFILKNKYYSLIIAQSASRSVPKLNSKFKFLNSKRSNLFFFKFYIPSNICAEITHNNKLVLFNFFKNEYINNKFFFKKLKYINNAYKYGFVNSFFLIKLIINLCILPISKKFAKYNKRISILLNNKPLTNEFNFKIKLGDSIRFSFFKKKIKLILKLYMFKLSKFF
jgi:hypothetical protein